MDVWVEKFSRSSEPVQLRVSGFKHALVSILAVCVARPGIYRFANFPWELEDSKVLIRMMRQMGVVVERDGFDIARFDTVHINENAILDGDVAGTIHGSIYLIPAFLARSGRVSIYETGGCRIGSGPSRLRPQEHVINTMAQFGAIFVDVPASGLSWEGQGPVSIDVQSLVRDSGNSTSFASGITKTAIILGSVLGHPVDICGAYLKNDVRDLLRFIQKLGVLVNQIGDRIRILSTGGHNQVVEHTIADDSIEAVTYLTAAFFSRREIDLELQDVSRTLNDIQHEVGVLKQMGFRLLYKDTHFLTVIPPKKISSVDFEASPTTIYSDSQPFLSILNLFGDRPSTIGDLVWPTRFDHLVELRKAGVKAERNPNGIYVEPWQAQAISQPLWASDLRCAAALAMFSSRIPGETIIRNVQHIARGYEYFWENLRKLGLNFSTLMPRSERQIHEL